MQINTVASQLRELIYGFLNHKDFSREGNLLFKQKERQLIDFSKTPNSLPASLLLLENDANDQVRFFTTMIIKDKLKYDFYQLDEHSLAETHSRLVRAITLIPIPAKPVLSNLSLCLVYLYIHCIDKIGNIMQFFSSTFPTDSMPEGSRFLYFFKYLEMLPEEIHNHGLVIDQQARSHAHELLKAQQTEILSQMHKVCQTYNTSGMSMLERAVLIDAFANWLELTEASPDVTSSLHNHSLMTLALQSFNNDYLSAPSMRCLLAAVSLMRNPDNNEGLYQFLGKNLFALINEVENQLKDEMYEPAENFITVLCDYGSYSSQKFIASYNPEIEAFFAKMLEFTENTELDIFKSLIDFWECIIHAITTRQPDSPLPDATAHQIIAKIYVVFCARIEYSNDQISDLNDISENQLTRLHQSFEEVQERREEARYIFECIAQYLGKRPFVKEVYHLISGFSPDDKKYWSRLQSHIFSLRDSVKDYPSPSEQICQTVLLVEKLTNMPIIVKKSFLRVFEGLFSMIEKNEEFILRILGYVSLMFGDKLLIDKVDRAYERCCKQNSAILVKHLSSLFLLFEQYPDRESTINGIIIVLREYPDLLSQHLPSLLKVPFNKLKSGQSKQAKIGAFNDLITLVTSIPEGKGDGNEALLEELLKQMWPAINDILGTPDEKAKNGLVQKSIKFLKLVMRRIPGQFAKYLPDIFTVMLRTFKIYPIGSYLYFYEATFATYYQYPQPEMQEYLKKLYIEYCQTAFSYLKSNISISENQRLVDDFIGLNKRLISFHLRMFLESQQFQSVLQFSVNCLGSNVPRAANTASQMFEVIFMIYWSPYSRKQWETKDLGEGFVWNQNDVQLYNQLKEYLLPLTPQLIHKMFNYLNWSEADAAKNNIEDCLLAIALAFPDHAQQIWVPPLQQIGQDILTRKEKEKLLSQLQAMGSTNHEEFLKAEEAVQKMIYLINRRYRNRNARSDINK